MTVIFVSPLRLFLVRLNHGGVNVQGLPLAIVQFGLEYPLVDFIEDNSRRLTSSATATRLARAVKVWELSEVL